MFSDAALAVIHRVDQLREQVDDHWQIPADEARLLAHIALASGAVSVLKVGVSYGFSTLHLASAAQRTGGHVHAVDISPRKIAAATQHLTDAGLIDYVTLYCGDAREQIDAISPAKPFDFVFLDAMKEQTQAYLDVAMPKLAPRCVIATDNTKTHPQELAAFVAHARALEGFTSCDVPVGNGFELTVRRVD